MRTKTKTNIKHEVKPKKKPKICIVTWFHCLRNVKLAIGAHLEGYDLELITKHQGFGLMNELQFAHIYNNGIRFYDTANQLYAQIRESNADIFWCHNEPDLLVELCVDLYKGKRIIIHDCHDLPTLHTKTTTCPTCKVTKTERMEKQFSKQEEIACSQADYVFVPTSKYIDIIHEKYGDDKKVLQVNSCPPSIFFPDTDLPRVNGMLYCGQVNVPSMKSQLPYRNLVPMFQYLTQLGIPTHIYHTTPSADLMPYTIAGASTYGVLRMYHAIHQYTRYDYGFVGSSLDCTQIQVCMPNKLWDCIAAGIPLINLNSSESAKFCVTNNIGIDVQGMEALSKVPWHDAMFWEIKRRNVRKIRYEYTAEKEVRKAFDIIGI